VLRGEVCEEGGDAGLCFGETRCEESVERVGDCKFVGIKGSTGGLAGVFCFGRLEVGFSAGGL
jgi:hypothetical protein